MAWGKNLTGQLGIGADSEMKECAMAPEKVSDERWLDCASGYYHSTAVKADGTLWAWGDNSQNQVNSSSTTIFTTPQQVGEDTDWTQVQAGLKMSAARCGLGETTTSRLSGALLKARQTANP